MSATSQPEQALALALAGTAARRARVRPLADALVVQVDPELLAATLSASGLLPLLGGRAAELAGARWPSTFADEVARAHARASRAGTAQELLTVRVLRELERTGVRALALKGPLLGRAIHGQAGLRVSSDVDLLVDPHDVLRACAVLGEFGYRDSSADAMRDAHGRPVLHHALTPSTPGLPPIDLHWRVHWYEEAYATEVVSHSIADPLRVRRPRPEDELAMLLLMFARDGFVGLRLATDVAAWWDTHGAMVATGAIGAIADRHPALAEPLAAAGRCAQRAVGLPAAALGLSAPRSVRARTATRLLNWPARGSRAQVLANASLVDGLLTPRGQYHAFVSRHLSRTASVSSSSGATAGPTRPLSATLHPLRVAARYAVALARIAVRREWAPLPADQAAAISRSAAGDAALRA
ncbi:MAG TPA: nucleotidyltransferase family protein [Conexibacter sp.]|nr:nucleotidyltransferase family protein [Conexibacter sp.]